MVQQSVECCDDRHESPFCPSCGRRLRERSPVDGLLIHIATTIKKQRGFIRTKRMNLEKPGAPELSLDNQIRNLECSVAKWESWRDALHELRLKAESKQ